MDIVRKKYFILALVVVGMSVMENSCAPFFKHGFDVTGISIEKRDNGYLVEIAANKRIDGVEAFVTQANWLVITLAAVSIDSVGVRAVQPVGIVQKIQMEQFAGGVQISMKLKEKVGTVEVVQDHASNNVFVDLFREQH